MTNLPCLTTVIDEIKCIYTQLDTSNQEDIVGALITIKDNLLARHDVISKKAELAKEQLPYYKCVLVDNVYIIVPITEHGHRFGKFNLNQDVIYHTHILPNRDDINVKLWEIPYGPSELLAWTAAYNKLVANKKS
jgi:hypothetical protein